VVWDWRYPSKAQLISISFAYLECSCTELPEFGSSATWLGTEFALEHPVTLSVEKDGVVWFN